ncbi:lysozyme M1 [Blastococcus sp. TF02-09]|uniref:lysozyme M1 n=1 Tax=Blastococcus sp. TF02-09 TaxID=2250576 RepID=UPI000DEB801F|nr:lysozyme M1 [Blastococcus sp. TF02-9]RBY80053.1 lysozyme M1 [Blastococcus sp. TF02-9]
MTRVLIRLLTVTALIASALLVPTAGAGPASTASAANLSYFNPGNIISDAVFFDGLAMNAPAVDAFLDAKGAKCVAGEMPCLKDYTQTTYDQAGDAYCAPYRGAQKESAGAILAKVGAACGINPRALIVLLQKEQSLITGTRPQARAYNKATGFACPDTAACNPAFSGFASQVYFGARQFQRYAAGAAGSYRAGRNNTVAYYPAIRDSFGDNRNNVRCGTSQVFIQNKATAGLYSYTPYQPNAAALAAGYGSGDTCSAYGNRNFYSWFTDWFGSTQHATGGAVVARANQSDTRAAIGLATGNVSCGLLEGGCFQPFERGAIYWSPATGAHIVKGAIHQRWAGMKWETGRLGYPTGEEICGLKDGGCFQDFQRGAMYWSPGTGAHPVEGSIQKKWASTRWETGYLGYPTGAEKCGLTDKGCVQQFQGGRIYWSSATGSHIMVSGPIWNAYTAAGYETSSLGYPNGEQVCGLRDGGCFQDFQRGALYWTSTTGARPVVGSIQKKWASTQWETGYLGYPTGAEKCGLTGNGCVQQFQGGRIYYSPASGAQVMVGGAVWNFWRAGGYEAGPLGYPTADQQCGLSDGGCSQAFQKGTVYTSASNPARSVSGAVLAKYTAAKATAGTLGYPTDAARCGLAGGGCFQQFQGGRIYASGSGVAATMVAGPIRDLWTSRGSESGALGYPTGDQQCGLADGGCSQAFQKGTVYTSASNPARIVSGAVLTEYVAGKAQAGALGYPVGTTVCGLIDSGCYQNFQKGSIYTSKGAGTHTVLDGPVRRVWDAQWWETGPLGYPTRNQVCGLTRGGCVQQFQGGGVYTTPATGTRGVWGAIYQAWNAQGRERGALKYPTTDEKCGLSGGRCRQDFEGGSIVFSPATGNLVVKGSIGKLWLADPGAQGYPTTGETCGLVRGGCFQVFQKGHVYWSPTTGAHMVSGKIFSTYAAQRWETGSLGYPTGPAVTTASTITQPFQGGTLVQNRSTGKVTRR